MDDPVLKLFMKEFGEWPGWSNVERESIWMHERRAFRAGYAAATPPEPKREVCVWQQYGDDEYVSCAGLHYAGNLGICPDCGKPILEQGESDE